MTRGTPTTTACEAWRCRARPVSVCRPRNDEEAARSRARPNRALAAESPVDTGDDHELDRVAEARWRRPPDRLAGRRTPPPEPPPTGQDHDGRRRPDREDDRQALAARSGSHAASVPPGVFGLGSLTGIGARRPAARS